MYLKAWDTEEAELLALMKQMRLEAMARKARESSRAVAKLSSLGGLAKSRWAPESEASAGPAPKDDAGVDCMASGESSKGTAAAEPVLKDGRVDPIAPVACPKGKGKKSVAPEEEMEEMRSAWTSIMGSEIVPGWPAWPESQHDECGTFGIPFPPERDWEACYERPSQNLWLYMSPAVQVLCQVSGEGLRKLVVRLRDQQAATPYNQLQLFRSWSGIAAWAHQLARGGQDIPITEFMDIYFRVSARDVFTKVDSGEA
ncbi:hypothetical protein J3459_011972 [Metarhizium acridum]|nr:hypothetical protein J3459_011972 [Metarhizium acridum]